MNFPKYIQSARYILIMVWFAPRCSKTQFFITIMIANIYSGPIKYSKCFTYISSYKSAEQPYDISTVIVPIK